MTYPTSNLDYGNGVDPDPAGDGIPDDLQAALNGQFAPLANPTFTGNVVVPDADAATEAMNRQTSDARYNLQSSLTFGVPVASQNSVTAAVTQPTMASALVPFLPLADAASGDEIGAFGPQVVPAGWVTATIEIVYSAASAASGAFRVSGNINQSQANGVNLYTTAEAYQVTETPPADVGSFPTWKTLTNAATISVTPGRMIWPTVRRYCTNVADTNTGVLRIHAVVLKKA